MTRSLALAGSALGHFVVAIFLLKPAPPARPRAPESVEFSLFAPEAPSAASSAVNDAELAPPETRQAPTAVAKSRKAEEREPLPAVELAVKQEEEEEERAGPGTSTTAERRVEIGRMDLSPLAAAQALGDLGVSCEVARGEDCASGDAGAPVAQKLADGPREQLIALRKELELKPQKDGSYLYEGTTFVATIEPDGKVSFDDKIRDLNDLVERHLVGRQINTSAKRQFMQNTAELRERLAVATEAQNGKRAKLLLQEALKHVLARADLTAAQKRLNVFGLWDDCANDQSGSDAQRQIEAFIRHSMPADGPLGFGALELAQLNRRKASRRPFAPYATEDAGSLPG